jgi:serine/threonine protein kinase
LDLQGSRLGKYQLDTEVGVGDLGVLYRARDLEVNRTVAVKVLAPHVVSEEETAARFLDAVRASARLNHPNIAAIYDAGRAGSRYVYVREFVKGNSLADILSRKKALSLDSTLSFLRQLADALDYAHAQGIVHGGVKPSNVIIGSRERVKLTDFGFDRPRLKNDRTVDGPASDSLRYVSPAQLGEETAGAASDLYGLAVIAHEMLVVRSPFDTPSAPDGPDQQVYAAAPSLSVERPEIPLAIDEVFERALAEQPERRFCSGTAFVTALAEAFEDKPRVVTAASSHESATTIDRQETKSSLRSITQRQWAFAGFGLVLVALLASVVALSGATHQPDATPAFDVVAVLTEMADPVSTATPIRTSVPAAANTATPEPATAIPTDAPRLSDEPGSILTVQVPVADVRLEPSRSSELLTQVLIGEKVRIHEKQDGWYRITAIDQPSPKDLEGYPGWLEADALSLELYEPAEVAIVIVPFAPARADPSADGPMIVELSIDSRLALQSASDRWVAIRLPDGSEGWVSRDHVRLACASNDCAQEVTGEPGGPRSADEILVTARQFIGTEYLWGGASSSAFDCSGYIYRVFHANGVTVPRDSLPMSQSGTWVEREELQPGDIVFTANGGPSGRVSHAALYIGDGQVLTTVVTDSITVVPLDSPRYRDEYWGARRYP